MKRADLVDAGRNRHAMKRAGLLVGKLTGKRIGGPVTSPPLEGGSR